MYCLKLNKSACQLQSIFKSSFKFGVFKPFQTCAALEAGAKHPIQQFGFEYVERQKKSERPLSPHLQIYKPQWTWYVSGGHRMTGVAMGIVVYVFSVGMLVLPFDFTTLMNFFYNLNMPYPLTYFLKYIIAYPVVFHALNGLRFLGFDLAYGMNLATVYQTAYSVVGVSIVISLILAYWRNNNSKAKN